jgi:hypothetical protein
MTLNLINCEVNIVIHWPLNANVDFWDYKTQHSKSLIEGLKSWRIGCEIWWLSISMTLECEIWWLSISMTLECEIWWLCISMILECEIWCMLILCLDNPWTWDVIYNGLVPQWPLDAKYYIWWFYALTIL